MRLTYILLILNSMAFAASASNYYVNSETGNDEFNGLSIAYPKKTIQQAADLTKPGDTVFVMNGTYTNDCPSCNVLNISRSGKKGRHIVFINYPRHRPVIRFNGWAGIALNKGVSYIEIEGFEVAGCNDELNLAEALRQPKSCKNRSGGDFDPRYNGNGIIVESSGGKHSHHITISKNIVHDCGGGGIGASQCDYVIVQGNIVYNTSWYSLFGTSGIAFYQFWNYDKARGYHNIIRNNKCYNNRSYVPWIKLCKIYDGNGIIVDDFRNKQNGSKLGAYKSRTLIENNICWYNGGTGIHAFQSDHVDIINNTAYCNSRTPGFNPGQILTGVSNDNRIINNILVSDSLAVINSNYQNTNLRYENNLHYNISHPDGAVVNISSSSCINADPKFVYAARDIRANFNLRSNSPGIKSGNKRLYSRAGFAGNRRAIKGAPCIGAYEN